MKAILLKTNIMCAACIAIVTPTLNEAVGETNWSVDITGPQKILTAMSENLTAEQLIQAVQNAGYRAEKIG